MGFGVDDGPGVVFGDLANSLMKCGGVTISNEPLHCIDANEGLGDLDIAFRQ